MSISRIGRRQPRRGDFGHRVVVRNAALHAAVLAAPDDDAPRMVYADWLMSNGDPRGDYIALALRGERIAPPPHDYGDVMVEYARGFVTRVTTTAAWMAVLPDDAFDDACVTYLHVREADGDPDPYVEITRRLAGMRLRTLGLELRTQVGVRALLASPHLAELVRLELRMWPGEDVVDAVVSAPLPSLRRLALQRTWDGPQQAARDWLARLAARLTLDELVLGYSVGAGAVAALVGTPGFASLTRFDASNAGLVADDAIALCDGTAPLTYLDLSGCVIGPFAAARIAAEPRFAQLTYLGLDDTEIGAAGLAALLASPHLSRDLELGLDGELLGLDANWRDTYPDGAEYPTPWLGEPPDEVTARFPRVTVVGSPRW